MKLPTLYKRDNNGSIRIWTVEVNKDDISPYYTISHGAKGGVQQEKINRVLVGKNSGKANQTTSLEQCGLEATSKWNKQKDRKGYVEDPNPSKILAPMLAQTYAPKRVKWPAYIQRKYDGCRSLAVLREGKCTLQSRTGKIWKVLQHIEEDLLKQFPTQNLILDGELFNSNITFQEILSGIKRDEKNEFTPQIQFHIYDIISSAVYSERKVVLDRFLTETDFIKKVVTYEVHSEDEMKEYHAKFLDGGFEGTIIRLGETPYEVGKRSYGLLKYKDWIDDEFEIIGAEQDRHQPKQCTFWCRFTNGGEFKAKPMGTTQVREQMWEDYKAGGIKGKMATVEYFGLTTSDVPVPRFAKVKNIGRDYE